MRFQALLRANWKATGLLPVGYASIYDSRDAILTESHKRASISAEDFLYKNLSSDDTPRNSVEFDKNAPMRNRMEALISRVQQEICKGIEEIDGDVFRMDEWAREGHGGGGKTCILQDGNVFEKAGVGISIVHGILPPAAMQQMKQRGKILEETKSLPFYACGISLVIHPHNPMAPTIHSNYRYFEVETGQVDELGKPKILSWFGGGTDLTPSYIFDQDARHFHAVYKVKLDQIDTKLYPKMKKDCDTYFFIPHRQEGRGIGGIFFDDFEENKEQTFQMVRACANSVLDSYVPILQRRITMPFSKKQKEWQQLRRGRYVEFNIMYDRGTKFGLCTPGARTESILMSLPLTARWEYMNQPHPGSWEAETLEILKKPVDWMEVTLMDLDKLSNGQLLAEIARRSKEELHGK